MLDTFQRRAVDWVYLGPYGDFRILEPRPAALLPGSFNPLHHGHTILAGRAAERLGLPAAFGLSVANVDKGELCFSEVSRRLDQFRGRHPVYLTRAPTFREKAVLFPGCVFVVGADTAARVVHPNYYGGDPAEMVRALDDIYAQGCRFLVGGRIDPDGRFADLGGVRIPPSYRDMFTGLCEREFRVDVSSTELQRKGTG